MYCATDSECQCKEYENKNDNRFVAGQPTCIIYNSFHYFGWVHGGYTPKYAYQSYQDFKIDFNGGI